MCGRKHSLQTIFRAHAGRKTGGSKNGYPSTRYEEFEVKLYQVRKSYDQKLQSVGVQQPFRLCGSEKINKLFCWPCLLFHSSQDRGVWSKTGFTDLNHLSAALKVHSSSKEHIDNAMAHKTFGRVRIDEALDHAREVAKTNHNLMVTKNREGLRTLIEVVCYLGSHGLGLRGHDERKDSNNRGNYKDLCSFVALRDNSFNEFLTKSNVFTGTSSSIQNEIIECVGKYMLQEIAKEVEEAPYAAVLMDETTDTGRLAQLSCALRYVKKNGKHWGFLRNPNLSGVIFQ